MRMVSNYEQVFLFFKDKISINDTYSFDPNHQKDHPSALSRFNFMHERARIVTIVAPCDVIRGPILWKFKFPPLRKILWYSLRKPGAKPRRTCFPYVCGYILNGRKHMVMLFYFSGVGDCDNIVIYDRRKMRNLNILNVEIVLNLINDNNRYVSGT